MLLGTLSLTEEQLNQLKSKNPNMGKNADIGKLAVEIVKLYFIDIDNQAKFENPKNGGDLQVSYSGKVEQFEIKGTAKNEIGWNSLRVSSQKCYDALTSGMPVIRVTNVGKQNPSLYLLNFAKHFEMVAEPRWRIVRLK